MLSTSMKTGQIQLFVWHTNDFLPPRTLFFLYYLELRYTSRREHDRLQGSHVGQADWQQWAILTLNPDLIAVVVGESARG